MWSPNWNIATRIFWEYFGMSQWELEWLERLRSEDIASWLPILLSHIGFQVKLEQLERLRSEDTPAASWLPILLSHIGFQVKLEQLERLRSEDTPRRLMIIPILLSHIGFQVKTYLHNSSCWFSSRYYLSSMESQIIVVSNIWPKDKGSGII